MGQGGSTISKKPFGGQSGVCDRLKRAVKSKLVCDSPRQQTRLSCYKMGVLFNGHRTLG